MGDASMQSLREARSTRQISQSLARDERYKIRVPYLSSRFGQARSTRQVSVTPSVAVTIQAEPRISAASPTTVNVRTQEAIEEPRISAAGPRDMRRSKPKRHAPQQHKAHARIGPDIDGRGAGSDGRRWASIVRARL